MRSKGIGDFVTRKVITVAPTDNLQQVIDKMALHNIGAVVVTSAGHPVGILTERDILKRVAAKQVAAAGQQVEPFMTPKLVTVGANDDVREVAGKMVRGNLRHVPVVENGELVGILSIKDVVAALLAVGDVG